MRKFGLTVFILSLSCSVNADLSVREVRHACNQFIEQQVSWLGSLTTSKEEAFLAGRCEGVIKTVVADSYGCYLARGKMVDAANKVVGDSYSSSVPEHVRFVLGCKS